MALPVPLEQEILRQCLVYLSLQPDFVCWRNNTGAFGGVSAKGKKWFVRAGVRGASDIIGFTARGAHFVAIEVKRPGGTFRPGQQEFLAQVSEAGGFACVVRSIDDLISQVFRWRQSRAK